MSDHPRRPPSIRVRDFEYPFSPCISEGETCFPQSPASDVGLSALESVLDQTLAELLEQKQPFTPVKLPGHKKKRGRKPLRPNDPVKKKTEEKDKYWLRAFRAYMKSYYPTIKTQFSESEQLFWGEHLGHEGKPEKGNKYLSYGRRYKNYLFSNSSFVQQFKDWFYAHGEAELSKKCKRGSGLWIVFYNYAAEELVQYVPRGSASLEGSESPLSAASPVDPGPQTVDIQDFYMILEDEGLTDAFLNT